METLSYNKLSEQEQRLVDKALHAIENAYNPYSRFAVGAAIRTNADKIHTGANIENAAHGASICAERVALSNAFSQGDYKITHLAIVGKGERQSSHEVTPPCGICRQVYYEVAVNNQSAIYVLLCASDKKKVVRTTIRALFPLGFGPAELEGKS